MSSLAREDRGLAYPAATIAGTHEEEDHTASCIAPATVLLTFLATLFSTQRACDYRTPRASQRCSWQPRTGTWRRWPSCWTAPGPRKRRGILRSTWQCRPATLTLCASCCLCLPVTPQPRMLMVLPPSIGLPPKASCTACLPVLLLPLLLSCSLQTVMFALHINRLCW